MTTMRRMKMRSKKILPPQLFFIFVVVSVLLHFVKPIFLYVKFPVNLIGIIFIVLGLFLNIWADHLFKKVKTTIKPFEKSKQLTTEGPFRFTRNPMYLGMLLALIGESLIFGSIVTIISPLLFIILINKVFIKYEENDLEKTFGKEFLIYKSRVRKWI